MGGTSLEVADIFRLYGEAYRKSHRLSPQQWRAMGAIERCRTAALGGHLYVCDECGTEAPLYNSCGNRHCPKCQRLDKERWLEARSADLLPVDYFHVVFTIPHTLHPLFRGNQKMLYDLLFQASKDTLLQIAADPRNLGARIGFLGILHTWSSDLAYHPHAHYVVPAGGLSKGGQRWVACPPRFLLPVAVLSTVFRGKFVEALERAYRTGQLDLSGPLEDLQHPVVFDDLIHRLYTHNWVVYAKPPFAGPEKVLAYLARYTHRVAISNERLICLEGDEVVFRYKDYARGGIWRSRRLAAEEFIRRFLQHVLPRRFVRIRYFGLLANRHRRENLERARSCLQAQPPLPVAPPEEACEEMLFRLTGKDPNRCPVCGQGRLRRERELPRDRSDRVSARAPP